MKHLNKFNESKSKKVNKPIDSEYLSFIFADFIDEGADVDYYGVDEDDVENSYWQIIITEPKIKSGRDIDKYIESVDKFKEVLLDIKTAINRVKDELPDIKVDLRVDESGESNAWVDTIERNINLTFSYK
jgi:hypothetical protein